MLTGDHLSLFRAVSVRILERKVFDAKGSSVHRWRPLCPLLVLAGMPLTTQSVWCIVLEDKYL